MEEITGGWPGVKQWSAPQRGGLPGADGERRDGSCSQKKFEISVLSIVSELRLVFEILGALLL